LGTAADGDESGRRVGVVLEELENLPDPEGDPFVDGPKRWPRV
jgi:hypothetical protein